MLIDFQLLDTKLLDAIVGRNHTIHVHLEVIILGDLLPIVVCDGRRHNKQFAVRVFKGGGISPAKELAEVFGDFGIRLPARHIAIGIGHHLAENDMLH